MTEKEIIEFLEKEKNQCESAYKEIKLLFNRFDNPSGTSIVRMQQLEDKIKKYERAIEIIERS